MLRKTCCPFSVIIALRLASQDDQLSWLTFLNHPVIIYGAKHLSILRVILDVFFYTTLNVQKMRLQILPFVVACALLYFGTFCRSCIILEIIVVMM